MRTKVTTVAAMTFTVFWNVMPCCLVDFYRNLLRNVLPSSHVFHTAYPDDGGGTYQTTRRHISEDNIVHVNTFVWTK
jgi:hypothetical protein